MTNYESPVILRTEELAEGVYLASGCYTASAYIHQTPQSGSGEYRIQVNGQHSADHTKEAQTLTISFSLPVTYTSSGGSLVSGSGTNTLVINYNYHQNPTDNIGLGKLQCLRSSDITESGSKRECSVICGDRRYGSTNMRDFIGSR